MYNIYKKSSDDINHMAVVLLSSGVNDVTSCRSHDGNIKLNHVEMVLDIRELALSMENCRLVISTSA